MRLNIILTSTLILGFVFVSWRTQPENVQSAAKYRDMELMFYNVENLFDTLNNPHTNDDEFLPGSEKQWNGSRYMAKLDSLAKVIQDGLGTNPGIVGLAEVENKQVLEDLINRPALSFRKFRIVHQESPDARGIDVALLLPPFVKTDSSYWVSIQFPKSKKAKTRDILMTRIYLAERPIWIAVNHFPSRLGGKEASAEKRAFVASQLRKQVDFYASQDTNNCFILMGDFNDEPMDSSLSKVLGARSEKDSSDLVNLFWPLQERGFGTYRYKGAWNMLDQIIVSRNLLYQLSRLYVPNGYARIYVPSYIREKEEPHKDEPLRTYAGNKYLGGFSDHFPVLSTLRYY
ncbi:MAG: endonuclease/exonuclease/phosphatase family protein [Bacteroidetes bacterium]|nr:endonuclease/exonuclease/phosphatase family protein [Bacteroidota bacterium]